MLLKANFELMADYNRWMNQNIYLAASELSTEELNKNRGAFFESIIGTLNHILVGDIVWLKRFADHPSAYKALDPVRALAKPKALNAILYSDFSDLHSAREQIDDVISFFVKELNERDLVADFLYTNSKQQAYNKNFAFVIQHFFNHQTHHRGQLSTLFSQMGIDIGATDLLLCIPDTNQPELGIRR